VPAPLVACARVALSRGDVRAVSVDLSRDEPHVEAPISHDGSAVEEEGFNLEATVRIAPDDDFGREHLLRYCARPPLSLARLIELPHGKLGYRIKKLANHRSKLRIMTPLEFLARLASLIPPPRHPLVRFHGAFAPRSSWRKLVVPKPRPSTSPPRHSHANSSEPKPPSPQRPPREPRTAHATPLIAQTEILAPNVLSVRHWDRLRSGVLAAASPRIDWPRLMSRTFDVDVLDCPKCEGRLRVRAIVDDPTTAAEILDELGIARAPPPSRAGDPAALECNLDVDPR
jgi:hypothetical protein